MPESHDYDYNDDDDDDDFNDGASSDHHQDFNDQNHQKNHRMINHHKIHHCIIIKKATNPSSGHQLLRVKDLVAAPKKRQSLDTRTGNTVMMTMITLETKKITTLITSDTLCLSPLGSQARLSQGGSQS